MLPFQQTGLALGHGDALDLRGADGVVSLLSTHPLESVEQAAYALATRYPALLVESKRGSLALHYRLAPDVGRARVCIEELLLGQEESLHRFGGKCVVNVVDRTAPDKGDAVARLVERSGASAAVFVGDDLNDESVFVRAPAHWLTVRIGRDDPRSRAAYFLDGHAEMALFLGMMLNALSQP